MGTWTLTGTVKGKAVVKGRYLSTTPPPVTSQQRSLHPHLRHQIWLMLKKRGIEIKMDFTADCQSIYVIDIIWHYHVNCIQNSMCMWIIASKYRTLLYLIPQMFCMFPLACTIPSIFGIILAFHEPITGHLLVAWCSNGYKSFESAWATPTKAVF